MKILSVYDIEFKKYGRIVSGYDMSDMLSILEKETDMPQGIKYVVEQKELQESETRKLLQDHLFGGMPIEVGWCNGHNTRLNCLEYHRDSEVNCGSRDFILLLGRRDEIDNNGFFDTKNVKAFYVPAGVLIEVFATTLHYAPCSAKKGEGFRMLAILPKGTNTSFDAKHIIESEDRLLYARNKWLLAHPDSDEAKEGATVALKGENIDIYEEIS